MKITLILLLTTAFSAFSMDVHSQNAKVSLDTNIMKVAQLISAIESQTNYLFVYSKKNVDLSRKVKINAKNKAVSEILDEVFIIRKSKFPQNPKRSVRFSGKGTKRSVQKRKARNTQKAETKVL